MPIVIMGCSMGTDRNCVFYSPCSCGKGKYEIDHCTPEPDWTLGKNEWYEASVHCPSCSEHYEISRFGQRFFLVPVAEIKAREAKRQQVHEASRALEAAAQEKAIPAALVTHLQQQSSAAARHRFLIGAGMESLSLPTFRKRWSGAQDWVRNHFSGDTVAHALKALKIVDLELSASVAKLEMLRVESNEKSLTPIGDAIYMIK